MMKLNNLTLYVMIPLTAFIASVGADQRTFAQLSPCGCQEPVCGCEGVCVEPACCDSAGCDSICCDSCDLGCSLGSCCCLENLPCLDNCCLGDPYSLFGECQGYSAGGWIQLGYQSKNLPAFNNYKDHLQLQQGWLWAEKAIDARCGFDIGGRIDYVYGTDGPNTQSFGTDPIGWDNSWDNGGAYGHAIPQLYVEAGYGDLSVKAGHFFTNIGYEVVPATGNFFYSHAYTMNFSEPFTHTGFLASYNVSEDVTFQGGYVLGWDSGFDDNGDAWLGGVTVDLTDRLTVAYASIAGRFNEAWAGPPVSERGYMQSVVANYAFNDCCSYIFQTDFIDSEDALGNEIRNTYGINQYLIRSINDCFAVGTRFEWWAASIAGSDRQNIFDWTVGANYRPHANLVIRPEIRFDWVDEAVFLLDDPAAGNNQTTFGIDAILTF